MSDPKEFKKFLEPSANPFFREMIRQEETMAREVEKRYNVKMEDHQSRILSLQSQINPHFLYNTLECIRSEALNEGSASIASMAKSLGTFFRYSISRKENIVTIQDELDNIRNYIRIQNYRFENRFHFSIDMEEEDQDLLRCQIPKMTLQPIVENSVFHGLETKGSESQVTIHIRSSQDQILLTVSDNGVGMDETQLTNLRNRMLYGTETSSEKRDPQKSHGNGIGLYNINQRLRLIFGEQYGLSIYSIPGEGTDVEVLMPIRTGLEEK
ncbi:MAG: sensor histidine kinase [Clostridiales bacterium]|nr:sensor histidine kinase [Clostridiales bacterium]